MKKTWMIGGGIAVLAALILALVFLAPGRRGGGADEVGQYVPQEALVFARLNDLAGLADGFPQSPLGRFLARDNVRAMLGELKAEAEVIEAYGQVCDDLADILKNPGFRALFGDDLSFALLPPDARLLQDNPEAAFRKALLVYGTIPAASMTSSMAGLLGGIAPGVKIEKEKEGKTGLVRIKIEGEDDVFAYGAGGVLALAWDKIPLLAAARARESGENLHGQAAFREARDFWRAMPGARSGGYANLAGMVAWLETLALEPSEDEALDEAAAFYAGMDYAYDATGIGAAGLEYRGRLRYRREALHPLFREMAEGGGEDFAPFALLNRDTLFFHWGGLYRPETLLEAIAESEPEKYDEMREAAREGLGMEIEDAATAFGPNYAVVLNGLARTAFMPVPDITLMTNVRDRARAERLAAAADRNVAEYGLGGEAPERAGDVLLYTWPVLREAGLAPTLGVGDRALFLGSMRDSLRPLIEGGANGASAAALSEEIRALLGADLAGKFGRAQNGFLLRPAGIADACEPLLAMLSGFSGRKSVLARELGALLRSGEALVGIGNWGAEHLDWEMTWIPAAPGNPPPPAPAQ